MKRKILIILIITLVLVGLISGLIYWLKYKKPEVNLCAKFPKIEGEISCQEAINLASVKYPGEIYEINKTKISLFTGEDKENVKEIEQNVWLIGIYLKEPMEIVEQDLKKIADDIKVSADIESGDLRIYEINWKTL